jgi:hypothetical protein
MFLFIEHPPPAELRLVVHALANTITAKTSIKYIFFFIELVCFSKYKTEKNGFWYSIPAFLLFQTDFNAMLTFKLRKIWFKYPQLGIHFHLILCFEKTDYEYSAATTNCFFRPRDHRIKLGNG